MIKCHDTSFLTPGQVALVGAGPGDPDLLTVAALKALSAADVVVYDALISPEILALLPDSCEKIFAGKRGGSPSTKQADISETLVELAKKNKRVVRLKGGDPFMFGRGGEEALRLVEENIPFRIVPGLSSGMAGPAYAGIPVTHRAVNANVAFITGHEQAENAPFGEDEDASRIDWETVGKAFPVLVIYMAMSNLKSVTERLINAGRSPDTPLALIRWATTPRQQTLVTTLSKAVDDVAASGLKSPVIIVVGHVVDYREHLQWFPEQPLDVPQI
ncbi:MAG: uroporphyrinogen-III C-methyltransferase [Magnetococcales bacterium]|nr:uroporphyrinogen-III C-methyltransferase [Magnetococcales bacterium]